MVAVRDGVGRVTWRTEHGLISFRTCVESVGMKMIRRAAIEHYRRDADQVAHH